YALHHPERAEVPVRPLDLAELGSLTFEPVDADTFACLRLAREAAIASGTAPCTLNAANEVAVYAFLAGSLRFLDIARVIEETLELLGRARQLLRGGSDLLGGGARLLGGGGDLLGRRRRLLGQRRDLAHAVLHAARTRRDLLDRRGDLLDAGAHVLDRAADPG